MDIVAVATEFTEAVAMLVARVRRFYYAVSLMGHRCPDCYGALAMLRESFCQCMVCGIRFDPTVVFQRCLDCGGRPQLQIRRYRCTDCGTEIRSHFVFDTLPFDQEYFRQRMADSRQRKRKRQDVLRRLVTENRSDRWTLSPAGLHDVPGLVDALDRLSLGPELAVWLPLCRGFDLKRYQRHLQAHLGPIEVGFDEIPTLEEDARKDRIWRFVAIMLMAHEGVLRVWQQGEAVLVRRNGAD